MIIAVDPSIRSCGVARLLDGKLQEFGVAKLANDRGDDYTIRASSMAERVAREIVGWAVEEQEKHDGPSNVIIETPAHWHSARGLKSEAGEDIQKVYWFVGVLIGRIWLHVDTISVVRPTEWKGNLTKDIMVARGRRHMSAFDEAEIVDLPHDAYEAACLAVWFDTVRQQPSCKAVMIKPDQGAAPTVTIVAANGIL